MKVLITGSCGLIGSEAVHYYAPQSETVFGVDNDMRRYFFGEKGTTNPMRAQLSSKFKNYRHESLDIRKRDAVMGLFEKTRPTLVIHTAAQPSHDWAAKEPFTDFEVNAVGTLNLLEATRTFCPEAVFIFTSTNKVYGDRPNFLPMKEESTRYEYDSALRGVGISETMSVDQSLHSLFGASKLSADILVQEYGRYFGLKTGTFRGGCLTGSHHSGVELHGFLSYLIHCAVNSKPYTVIGYKGKQVRDQIHARDVLAAFDCFKNNPRPGEVYNLGGGFKNSASVVEILSLLSKRGFPAITDYKEGARKGDHICYYTDMSKFEAHYPSFKISMSLENIIEEMIDYASNDHRKAA